MEAPLPPDFKEFLQLLIAERIEFLLVGGYAVSFHGYSRPTGDLDLWVAVNPANAARLVVALRRFGFSHVQSAEIDLLSRGKILRMGVPPVRIELMGSISGVRFEECYPRRVNASIDNVPVSIISRADLIANKRAAGRPKDQNDLQQLE